MGNGKVELPLEEHAWEISSGSDHLWARYGILNIVNQGVINDLLMKIVDPTKTWVIRKLERPWKSTRSKFQVDLTIVE